MLYDAYYEELQLYETDKDGGASGKPGVFNFAKSLSVKGADELLRNEGKKFLEMMERLAERRMRKEEAMRRYEKYEGGEEDNEEYEAEEGEEASGTAEEEYEDEDEEGEGDGEVDGDGDGEEMTDEQQLEEGKQMFQVFAAKMFEQRVLTAYREKVAYEKQRQLIEEEEAEKRAAQELQEAEEEKEYVLSPVILCVVSYIQLGVLEQQNRRFKSRKKRRIGYVNRKQQMN